MSEAAFIEAIVAAPQDEALRLVYADWLEEQGDSRGELIRIEEAARGLPAWDDRVWNARGRRQELRAKTPKKWLGRLGYRACYRPLFNRPLPARREHRWRLMHAFIETWHGDVLTDRAGDSAENIAAAEKRLALAFPIAMREFYEQVGRRLRYWTRQDKTWPLGHLAIAEDAQFPGIEFRVENQACARWYVPTNTRRADPPVRSTHPGTGEPEIEASSTFSEFALVTLVHESLWASDHVHSNQFGPYRDLAPFVGPKTGLSRCQLSTDYWVLGKVTLIEGEDLLLVYTPEDEFLYASARSAAAYQALPEELRLRLA